MHSLLSIHDVMPETMEKVGAIISSLPEACKKNMVLLVVPGRNWQAQQIETLKQWQQQGFILAGHGWTHEAKTIRGLYHRTHALLISRRAAEHLALSEQEIIELMQRNYSWFEQNGLDSPDYYVPPAWALGLIDKDKLRSLPFHFIESTTGLFDVINDRFISLPLSGFEADTWFRKTFLGGWNRLQKGLSTSKKPLRISIHPNDPELLLKHQLAQFLGLVSESRHYHSL